jgi:predicted outer membrane repeat protein
VDRRCGERPKLFENLSQAAQDRSRNGIHVHNTTSSRRYVLPCTGRCVFLILSLFWVRTVAPAHAGSILFVDDDAPPGGDGASWRTALNDLNVALDLAAQPPSGLQEIWVAAGVYRPRSFACEPGQADPREATFTLGGSVALYGGFGGHEQSIVQRDIQANPTILSGDLHGPAVVSCCKPHDVPGCECEKCQTAVCDLNPACCDTAWDAVCVALAQGLCGELCPPFGAIHSFHVVTCESSGPTSILDGFTITGGKAIAPLPQPEQYGGGIYCNGGDVQIANCTFFGNSAGVGGGAIGNLGDGDLSAGNCFFTDNAAPYGAAIYNLSSNFNASSCSFHNTSPTARGGSMYNALSTLTLYDCQFDADSRIFSSVKGGAIANEHSYLLVINCDFRGLRVSEDGGAVYSRAQTVATFATCSFINNCASSDGGAIANETYEYFTLVDCHFEQNQAVETPTPTMPEQAHGIGGAIYSVGELNAVDCTFRDNRASGWAGAIYNPGPLVTGCLFESNTAMFHSGGAIYGAWGNSPLNDCTFINNTAPYGGAMIVPNGFEPVYVTNSLFVNNSAYSGGALLAAFGCEAHATNCAFIGNSATSYGGAVATIQDSIASTVNCTVVSNHAGVNGGGLYAQFCSRTTTDVVRSTNSILWHNTAGASSGQNAQIAAGPGATAIADYSCIEGLADPLGFGNIASEPMFISLLGPDGIPGNGDEDLRLTDLSPCIDAANNSALPSDLADLDDDRDTLEPTPVDLDGLPRFVDVVAAPDTGCGAGAIVDMGSYENQTGIAQQPLFADLTGDGLVGPADLAELLAHWGACEGCCLADLNHDGNIGPADLANLLGQWAGS